MEDKPAQLQIKKSSNPWLKWTLITIGVIVALVVIGAIAGFMWYQDRLKSPHPGSQEAARITIAKGSSISQIAENLQNDGIIKDANVFQLYYRLNGTEALQAGVYKVEKGADVPSIISKLAAGDRDEFQLTFKPGESLAGVRVTLKEAGYKDADIDKAFKKMYDYPMMKGRTADDIEGFLLPDTYNFATDYTAENVLTRPLQHMQEFITEQKLEEAYKRHGLTLYQGITLASIIQKEVNAQSDMRHVSQVFHSRLKEGMKLGSDPTFVYPAKKEGVQPHPELDSPYNTYKIDGLPPGPIAMPGKEALLAAAHPSDTDDFFFVAGDDGTTHFSKTNAEHEALTKKYCQERCRLDIF